MNENAHPHSGAGIGTLGLNILLVLAACGLSGCGESQAPRASSDVASIDETVKAVQAGQEDPRKLRALLKREMTGKDETKVIPKTLGKKTPPGR